MTRENKRKKARSSMMAGVEAVSMTMKTKTTVCFPFFFADFYCVFPVD